MSGVRKLMLVATVVVLVLGLGVNIVSAAGFFDWFPWFPWPSGPSGPLGPPPCTPIDPCEPTGPNECGWHSDGCGDQEYCGSCGWGETCENGECVCDPIDPCDYNECGWHSDGCGGQEYCGSCGPYSKCQAGNCMVVDEDHDGVKDSKDKCPGTPHTCTTGNGKINPNNGCPYEPFSFHIKNDLSQSCPMSSIPVDPENGGCLSSSDARTDVELKIGSYTGNPSCDTVSGTTGWHDPVEGRNYCELKIEKGVPVGKYKLHAVYRINGVSYDQTFKTGFRVEEECSTSTTCSHGGRVMDSPSANLEFSGCTPWKGKYLCEKGARVSVKDISSYKSVCSNGAKRDVETVGVVAWVYSDQVFQTKKTNLFAGCEAPESPVPMKYREGLLKEEVGLGWDCNIGWHSGGSKKKIENFYTFDQPGKYTIYLDYINAVCDSPDYICPTGGTLCKIGTMSSDYKGFKNMEVVKAVAVDPHLRFSSRPEGEVFLEGPEEWKAFAWKVKNDGFGDVEATVSEMCGGLECDVSGFNGGTIPEGEEVTIVLKVKPPCKSSDYSKNIGLSLEYEDVYGFTDESEVEDTVKMEVKVPQPELKASNGTGFSWQPGMTTLQDTTWKLENTGRGKIRVVNLSSECPPGAECGEYRIPEELDEGEKGKGELEVDIENLTANITRFAGYEGVDLGENRINLNYILNVTHLFTDGYGLGCIGMKAEGIQVPFSVMRLCNQSYHPWQEVNISQRYCCVNDGSKWLWSTDCSSKNVSDEHCYTDIPLDEDVDCCELEGRWFFDQSRFDEDSSPYCCGDDFEEYIRKSEIDNSLMCCDKENDCVYGGRCYSAGEFYTVGEEELYCGPVNGEWYKNPVGKFEVHHIMIALGGTGRVSVLARNLQEIMDQVTLEISGYEKAEFASNGKRNLTLELNPGQEKKVHLIVYSSEPKSYQLGLEARSKVSGLVDEDQLRVRVGFPASFSGLNLPAVVLLILAAVVVYRRTKG